LRYRRVRRISAKTGQRGARDRAAGGAGHRPEASSLVKD
jgi:hypothetical protein